MSARLATPIRRRSLWIAVASSLVACGEATPEPATPAAPPPSAPAPPEPVDAPMPEPTPPEPSGPAPDAETYAQANASTTDAVQQVVRQHFDRVGDCYREGLERHPDLKGEIEVRLTITQKGEVVGAVADKDPPGRMPRPGSDRITDHAVVTCVEGVFEALRFPPTNQGMVNLVYPVILRTE